LHPTFLGCDGIQKAICLGLAHRLVIATSTVASATPTPAPTKLLEPAVHDLQIPPGIIRIGILSKDASKRLPSLEKAGATHVACTLPCRGLPWLATQTVSHAQVVGRRLVNTSVCGSRCALKRLDRPLPVAGKQQGRSKIVPVSRVGFALSRTAQILQTIGSDLLHQGVDPKGVLEQRLRGRLLSSSNRLGYQK